MDWIDLILFCLVFHSVDRALKAIERHRQEVALTRALRELSLKNEKIDNQIKRIK